MIINKFHTDKILIEKKTNKPSFGSYKFISVGACVCIEVNNEKESDKLRKIKKQSNQK